MKNINKLLIILCIFLIFVTGWLWLKVDRLEQTVSDIAKPGLYEVMTQMQTVVHKMNYAIEFENKDLLDFYIHELEELSDELIDADLYYHEHPVGQLTNSMLYPTIEELEDAVDSGNWLDVQEKKSILVQSCNTCHITTGYDSIIIREKADINPFNQDFSRLD